MRIVMRIMTAVTLLFLLASLSAQEERLARWKPVEMPF